MSSSESGFLIVLSDIKAEHDRDYLSWLTTEHVQERLGIEGFLSVRVFRKPVAGGHQYFIWYRLKDADVVDSPAYLHRLNNPTPWSQRVMPLLENFGRGGGTVVASAGTDIGEMIFPLSISEAPQNVHEMVAALKSRPQINAVHCLATDAQKSKIRTSERDLRNSDQTFSGLIVLESNSQAELTRSAQLIPAGILSGSDLVGGWYREVFSLSN